LHDRSLDNPIMPALATPAPPNARQIYPDDDSFRCGGRVLQEALKKRRPRRLARPSLRLRLRCDTQKKAEQKKLATLKQFFVLIAFSFRFLGPINVERRAEN
jgi:hypothetical protein